MHQGTTGNHKSLRSLHVKKKLVFTFEPTGLSGEQCLIQLLPSSPLRLSTVKRPCHRINKKKKTPLKNVWFDQDINKLLLCW